MVTRLAESSDIGTDGTSEHTDPKAASLSLARGVLMRMLQSPDADEQEVARVLASERDGFRKLAMLFLSVKTRQASGERKGA